MDAYMGMIFPWAMNWAPVNFMLCQGQLLPVTSYQALFSLLGTTYGGNGTTDFALPNLQGVFMLGAGQNIKTGQTYVEAQTGGQLQTTLTVSQMPTHTHAATFQGTGGGGGSYTPPNVTVTVQASPAAGTQSSPTGNYLAGSVATAPAKNLFVPGTAAGTLGNIAGVSAVVTGGSASGGGITGGNVTVQPAGGTTPVPTMPPYLVLNYIICVYGIFPSRQ